MTPQTVDYLEGLLEGFVAYDERWIMTYMNAAAERILGRARDDVLGKTWHQAFPHAVGNPVDAMYQRVMRTRRAERMEYYYPHYQRWLEISASPVRSGGVAVYFSEIGGRKRAEEALRESERRLSAELVATRRLQETSVQLVREDKPEALYEQILDAAVDIMRSQYASIQMLDPRRGELKLLGFRGFNPEAAKFWQWVRPASESTCGMALRSGTRCVVADVERCDFMAGSDDLATYLQTGIHAVQTTPLVSRTGELIGMISTHWSEPHQPQEHELRLLDVLARQAADLIERSITIEKLRVAHRRKDEFLAMLSHELRNPLAPIRNAVTLLDQADGDAGMRATARGILERQVTHLIRLVDDLLDITRASHGDIGLKKHAVPLAEVLDAALETSRPLVDAGAHQLVVPQVPQSVTVFADPVRLAQALSNLVNNAAKYTPRGGRIELAVQTDAGEASVCVRDNGVGIAPEELPLLFDMFMQSESTRLRAPGGLGIGLALARKLAELHGGTIEGRSEGPGRGAEFTLRIPLLAAGQAGKPPARPQPAAAPARRVLVVDDNADAAEGVAAHLRRQGHEVRTAVNGERALAIAREFEPQVALVDIGLPGMSGYELAHRLRGTSGLLIALTGYGQQDDRSRAAAAGFHHHFLKPADPHDIQAAIGAWHPS